MGILLLIGKQNDRFAREDQRSSVAHGVRKRAERHAPSNPSLWAVSNQAEIAEKDIDILSVGNGRVRGRIVEPVRNLAARPRLKALP